MSTTAVEPLTERRTLLGVLQELRGSGHDDSPRRRLASGTLWALLGGFASQSLAIATSVAVARLLGQVRFGEFGMIQGTITAFGIVAGGGLGMTATKHVAECRVSDPARVGRIVSLTLLASTVFGCVFALLLLAAAPGIAASALKAPHLTTAVRIGSALLLFNILNGVQVGVLTGFEAFRVLARLSFQRSVATVACTLAGLLTGGLNGALTGNLAALGIGAWLGQRALGREMARNNVAFQYRAAARELRLLWTFSFPSLLSSILVGPVTWLAALLLARGANGYAELGVFNAANQWRTAILFVPTLMGQVIVPVLASMPEQREKAARVLRTSVIACGLAVAPVIAALCLFSGHIMLLYGRAFAGREHVLQISGLTAGLLALQLPIGLLITASGRMWLGAVMNLGWATVLLGAAWFFVSRNAGAEGLALAYLIAYLAHASWTLGFAWRVIRRNRDVSRVRWQR
jgi:O-antigen/teichoic acid export membrane protein